MDNNPRLAPGFVTVERAIELIKADTRDKAVVDLQFLVNNIPYMKVGRTYNIRLLKTENGKVLRDGTVYVQIANDYDKAVLLRAITDAYNQRTGILVSEKTAGVNRITTVVDEEAQQTTGAPRENTNSDMKAGDAIISNPDTIVQQGV